MFEDEFDAEPSWSLIDYLNSKALVALITVGLGGLFTTCIASSVQQGSKERELKMIWMRERAQHRLMAQKSFLDEQQTAATNAFRTVGRMRNAARALLDTTREAFSDAPYPDNATRQVIDKQRIEMRSEFNAADDEWQLSSATYGFLLGDHPFSRSEIMNAWSLVHRDVDALKQCAEKQFYTWFETREPLSHHCEAEDGNLMRSWGSLSTALRASRAQARWRWETAQELQEFIDEPLRQ